MSTYAKYDPDLVHVEYLAPSTISDEETFVAYGGTTPTTTVGGAAGASVAQRFQLTDEVTTAAIRLRAGPEGITGNTQIFLCANPNGTQSLGWTHVIPNVALAAGEELLVPFHIRIPGGVQAYLYLADRGGGMDMSQWAAGDGTTHDGTTAQHPTNGEQLFRGGEAAGNDTALWFQILGGEFTYAWTRMPSSSVTLTESYDVSETGILALGQNTASLSWTYYYGDWDAAPPGLSPGSEVRVSYGTGATREMFSGIVTDISTDTDTDPDALRHGYNNGLRVTQTIQATHKWWVALQSVRYWDALAAESAKDRLNRFGISVSLNGEPDGIAPAEETPNYSLDTNNKVTGGTTLADLVRLFSEQVRRPVRLQDPNGTGYDALVQIVRDDDFLLLDNGITEDDWSGMFHHVSTGLQAGAARLSPSLDDSVGFGTADLVTNDARLLVLAWRPPDVLPMPFSTPAAVQRITRTMTSTQCGGTVEFYFPTPREIALASTTTLTGGTGFDSAGLPLGQGVTTTRPRPNLPSTRTRPAPCPGLFGTATGNDTEDYLGVEVTADQLVDGSGQPVLSDPRHQKLIVPGGTVVTVAVDFRVLLSANPALAGATSLIVQLFASWFGGGQPPSIIVPLQVEPVGGDDTYFYGNTTLQSTISEDSEFWYLRVAGTAMDGTYIIGGEYTIDYSILFARGSYKIAPRGGGNS